MMPNMDKSRSNTKITGYLEKKGKNKMIGSYKKYWFVLEGGLLLYYRSKVDYDTISPFKGCINLGPPCNIKPLHSTTGAFQIQTRTATITLRAVNQEEQNRWMQAIMLEINPNKNQQRMSHFRYSLDELPQSRKEAESDRKLVKSEEPLPTDHMSDAIIQRLQKIGGQSYGNPLIGTISKASTRKDKGSVSQESIEKGADDLRNIEKNSEANSSENRFDSQSFENIYEQIPSNSTDIQLYDAPDLVIIKKSMSLPRQTQNSFRSKPDQNRPATFNEENDIYDIIDKDSKKTIPIHANENKDALNIQNNRKNSSHLVQNDLYSFIRKTSRKTSGSDTKIEEDCLGNDIKSSISEKIKNVSGNHSSKSNTSFFSNKEKERSCENEQTAPTEISTHRNSNKSESILFENDLYGCAEKDNERNKTQKSPESISAKNITSFFSNKKNNAERNAERNKRSTLLQENEIYASAAEVYEDQSYNGKIEQSTIENDLYAHPHKARNSNISRDSGFLGKSDQYSDTIYTEIDTARDYNENDVVEEKNPQGNDEENLYSIPDQYRVMIAEETTNDAEYVEYAEPQCEEENKNKLSLMKGGKLKKTDKDDDKSHPKLKKRSSFIRRVWKRKAKHKEKTENENIKEENLYETVPEFVVDKLAIPEGKTLLMLSELQNILERKKPILIEKISSDAVSPTSLKEFETISETTNDRKITEKEEPPGSKKGNQTSEPLTLLEPAFSVSPIKTQNSENPSPFHDIPKTNKPLVPPPTKIFEYESIDEILDDLDNENNNKNKVKSLIKRFSGTDLLTSDVVLRTNRKTRDLIDSDELSRLLEELAEVTNAPILTPGVTSSLNGSNIENIEFSKLLPERRRRYSEPDYDIPRPHKSLTILPKREESSENVIGSTRFFGPILKPSDMEVSLSRESSEALFQLNSITPDSLEGTSTQRTPTPLRFTFEEDSSCDYHHYYKFMDKRTFLNGATSTTPNSTKNCPLGSVDSDIMIENDIYVDPKSIRFNLKTEHVENPSYGQVVDATEDEEVFVDSLENDNSAAAGVYTAL